MPTLRERFPTIQVDEPREAAGLQVFGLRWPASTLNYTTLDEGVASGQLQVTEVTSSGTVPTLQVANKGTTMAFLMAGEQLAGGKQNRVLNASIMIAAQSELPIPVSCVESGRWAYRSPTFGSSGTTSHSHLRRMMHSHATAGYRTEGKPTSKQGEVWAEVDRKLTESHSLSDTRVLQKAYEDLEVDLGKVVSELTPPEGACGAVFAYGGRIIGFDLFDQPATLAKLWPKLVRAYAIDARVATAATPVKRAEVEEWLRTALEAREEVFKSPGVGDDVRLETVRLTGAGLLVEGQPVHVEVFAQMGA
jgi:hypothetical protein